MKSENGGFSKGFLTEQRRRLEMLREQLSNTSAVAAQRHRQDAAGNGPLDAGDLGEITTERDTDEALDKVAESRLRSVGRALQKISEGTYGLSDASGKPISKQRLERVPEAIYTVEEEEARESDFGQKRPA